MVRHRFSKSEEVMERDLRSIPRPGHDQRDHEGVPIHQYFGDRVFDFRKCPDIPAKVKKELLAANHDRRPISAENAAVVAKAVTKWAVARGATHFCHWFQPLTGSTAQKQESFIDFDENGQAIERLSAHQLAQSEPDASSFPSGGSRSTFEARGYTVWDVSSPMFLKNTTNGAYLCIPSAFVTYHGESLDIKTPLLRSLARLNSAVGKFLGLLGETDQEVKVTCGPEQEYFLVDQAFYYARPDLVMTGRALFGQMTPRHQQLHDHYFGNIPRRVLSFMQELDYELYRLGIPSKMRHNEVAPGQFEVAPIFTDANLANDQNQLMMALIQQVARRHQLVALLHEKPFAGLNGSGKHLNWSLATEQAGNLLDPGKTPAKNYRFLAFISIILEAVYRHADVLRMAVASCGNDHRLGGHEAPPSIISVFLGETLTKILEAIESGQDYASSTREFLDVGAEELVALLKDNTDRNRTSPFAFTGNRFEFRAVGAGQPVGLALTFLNSAVAEVFSESSELLAQYLAQGQSLEAALKQLIKHWYHHARPIVFNGDGYHPSWIEEARRRGLPNLKNTVEALAVLQKPTACTFLTAAKVLTADELQMRSTIFLEDYLKRREIELVTLISMIKQYVLPAALAYKAALVPLLSNAKKDQTLAESKIFAQLTQTINELHQRMTALEEWHQALGDLRLEDAAAKMAAEGVQGLYDLAIFCGQLEELVPHDLWPLPTFYDMLFLA